MKAKAVQVVEAEGVNLPEFWNLYFLPSVQQFTVHPEKID